MTVNLRSASGVTYTTDVTCACDSGKRVICQMSTIAIPDGYGPARLFCEQFTDSNGQPCHTGRNMAQDIMQEARKLKYQKCPVMLSPNVAAIGFQKSPSSETEWYCLAL